MWCRKRAPANDQPRNRFLDTATQEAASNPPHRAMAELCDIERRLAMTFHDLTQRLRGWLRTVDDIKRLRALDNRLLGDMGIERNEIADLVSGRCSR